MFQTLETGSQIDKKAYEQRLPELRAELLKTQFELRDKNIPFLIIISGVEGAGKGHVVNLINEWMDVRYIETKVFHQLTDEEIVRPEFWRYWRVMPSRGVVGIFFGSWYTTPIIEKSMDRMSTSEFESRMFRIRFLEQSLTNDSMLIAKFWLHISRKEQKKRFKKLESDPRTKWRVTEHDWEYHKNYEAFVNASEKALRLTDTSFSPWNIVDASDFNFRNISVAETLLSLMKNAIANGKKPDLGKTHLIENRLAKGVNVLDKVTFHAISDKKAYKKEFDNLSLEIEQKAWKSHTQGISTVLVFEGWDAAGKGGAIRRVVSCLDAKFLRVIQTAAPSDEEKAQHYLWRFWRHIPRNGNFTIYDRSWYGRVLVERVEGFATELEWKRSYLEINDFEQHLVEQGTNVVKFWMHITPEEQLKRFKLREITPHKSHKITDDDWRNREKWVVYKEAVHDMIAKTDTAHAPWKIIPANDKKYGRLAVLKHLDEALSDGLKKAKKRS